MLNKNNKFSLKNKIKTKKSKLFAKLR